MSIEEFSDAQQGKGKKDTREKKHFPFEDIKFDDAFLPYLQSALQAVRQPMEPVKT